ncbi:MAG: YceI family protein [Myxococcales bacterium]|nr:YceI family protein [Myxococcales bacterium]MCB9718490.1 YceI family protein [Myxococcales bacterium]
MPRFDASSARCEVLTFKEGLLSAVAHDLCLRVERFTIELHDDESIEARFEAGSLRVEHAMKDGRPAPGTLSDRQRREIEGNIVDDVLHAKRHPEIGFRSTRVQGEGDERRIEGTLRLHGQERPLRLLARRSDGRWTAEVELHQPDFGIKPYSAMLGTLKIRPQVRVRVSLPG